METTPQGHSSTTWLQVCRITKKLSCTFCAISTQNSHFEVSLPKFTQCVCVSRVHCKNLRFNDLWYKFVRPIFQFQYELIIFLFSKYKVLKENGKINRKVNGKVNWKVQKKMNGRVNGKVKGIMNGIMKR